MIARKKSFKDSGFVVAGRVRRAWGTARQLAVDWNNGSCPVEVGADNVYLKAKGEDFLSKFVIAIDHSHGSLSIVTLKGLSSRSEAERYRGSNIWVEKGKLPLLREGEYYAYQLLEMRVETNQGEYLGNISEIFPTGSNDVYVVRNGAEELLIPATQDVVKKVDIKAGLMTIELIEGLI